MIIAMPNMLAVRFKILLPVICSERIFPSMNQKSQYKGYGIKFHFNSRALRLCNRAKKGKLSHPQDSVLWIFYLMVKLFGLCAVLMVL
jgi:hypothetical protein